MSWFTYNCLRFHLGGVRGYSTLGDFMSSSTIIIGQIAFPLMMMGVYCLSGYYNEVFRKSRLSELMTTFKTAVINTLLAFFIALINDMSSDVCSSDLRLTSHFFRYRRVPSAAGFAIFSYLFSQVGYYGAHIF